MLNVSGLGMVLLALITVVTQSLKLTPADIDNIGRNLVSNLQLIDLHLF